MPALACVCILGAMLRPHSPHENPAERPAHSGEGEGRTVGVWASPWELDQEWQDAPPARKKRPVFAEEAAAPRPAPPKPPPEPEKPAPAPPKRRPAFEPDMENPPLTTRSRLLALPRPEPKPVIVLPPREEPVEREVSWGTLIILSMAALAFVFVAWVFVQDQEPGFDEDLLLRPPVDQATTIRTPEKLRKFLRSVTLPEDPVLRRQPPWMWDTPRLSYIMQANGTALDNLRDLLEDADWHGAHAAWHAEDLGGDPRWAQALLLKQVEAAYLSRRLQEEEAFTAAIDLAEMGWRLEQIQAWPSFYHRALEAQTRAAQTLADLLRQTKLPESSLRQFQRQFTVSQPAVGTLEAALNAFYVHEKKLILGPQSGENLDTMPGGAQLRRPGRLFFKPNETLGLFATAFRQLKDEVKAPLALTSEVRLKNAPARESSFQPNGSGQAYFTRRMQAYTPLPAALGLARARGNIVITLFAIRRCIAEKKIVPTSLEQLRTLNYLLDVPADPYSGAPLQYSLSRGLLWSVGNDLKSANGLPTEPPMNDDAEPTAEVGIGVAAAVR